MTEQHDMDAILDAALDELDDDDDEIDEPKANVHSALDVSRKEADESTKTPAQEESLKSDDPDAPKKETSAEKPAEPSSNPTQPTSAEMFQNMLRDFIEAEEEGDPDELVGQFMQKVGIQVSPEKKGSSPSKSNKPKSSPSKSNAKNDNVDETISALLEDMAKASMSGGNNSSMPDEEELLKGMFSQFQNAGEDFNPESFNSDAVIDGMMEQLLSKDLMYEPMKQVTESFPKWLQDNQQKVTAEEYQQRRKQFECFKKLVHTYETDPENVKDLLELMQEVQEYGQPPQDIINEIAPGLELDEDGMPKMNPLEGMFGGGGNEECRIM